MLMTRDPDTPAEFLLADFLALEHRSLRRLTSAPLRLRSHV